MCLMKHIYTIQKLETHLPLIVSMKDIARVKKSKIIGKRTGEHSLHPKDNSHTVSLEEDPETGDLILPIPTDLLNQMGWFEGDEVWWDINDDGHILIKKKEEDKKDDSISS